MGLVTFCCHHVACVCRMFVYIHIHSYPHIYICIIILIYTSIEMLLEFHGDSQSFRCWCMFIQPPSSPPSYILFKSSPSLEPITASLDPLDCSHTHTSPCPSHVFGPHCLSRRRDTSIFHSDGSRTVFLPSHPLRFFCLFVITLLLLRAFKLHLNLFSQLHILSTTLVYIVTIVSSLILVLWLKC